MSKKLWYTVTFSAKMTEDDVRAMKKCFYDAMEETMQISPCAALDIALEDDQDEDADLILESDTYELDLKTGNIKVDKSIFDDFIPNNCINICFVDDNVEGRIAQYKMISEDDDGIVMEYLWEV